MSIEETVYKLKNKYQERSYGVKSYLNIEKDPEDILLQSDLTLLRKDTMEELNMDDWVVLSKEDYINRIKNAKYTGKLELLNEILEDNPDKCCITGCNIK